MRNCETHEPGKYCFQFDMPSGEDYQRAEAFSSAIIHGGKGDKGRWLSISAMFVGSATHSLEKAFSAFPGMRPSLKLNMHMCGSTQCESQLVRRMSSSIETNKRNTSQALEK